MRIVTKYLHLGDNETDEDLTEEQRENVTSALYEVQFAIDVDTGRILSVRSGKQIIEVSELRAWRELGRLSRLDEQDL